jgi:hypothetical protein
MSTAVIHGARHVALVQRFGDKLDAAVATLPIGVVAIGVAEDFLQFANRARREIPASVPLQERIGPEKQPVAVAAKRPALGVLIQLEQPLPAHSRSYAFDSTENVSRTMTIVNRNGMQQYCNGL